MDNLALDVLKDRGLELGPAGQVPSIDASATRINWRLAKDENGVAWLVLDQNDSSANTLSQDVMGELDSILAQIEQTRPKALVIRSAKPGGFIAGADIRDFAEMTDTSTAAALLERGHAVLDRLDRLPLPTIAVVHGYCLGGGLEVALACDFRIAIDGATFGFPEVLLGLHPGLGGTVRLTHLINPVRAMTMMLTGKSESARVAKSLGLVDVVTQERHVRAVVQSAVSGDLKRSSQGVVGKLLNLFPFRVILAKRMRREAEKKAPPANYPSPFALIDLWEEHGGNPSAMQKAEISSFAKLLSTKTSQNLVRVFFLRQMLKGLADGRWNSKRVHVIGAGAMGADIAAWCAWHGFVVSLADMKPEPLASAIKRAAELYGKIGKRNRLDIRNALDRLIPDLKGEGVAAADIIIEAVPENLDLKKKIFATLEPKMKAGAILATNTSSIRLEELRAGLKHPDRFVGIHFFNPVSRMQLVEVVEHDQASDDVLKDARAFLGRIDRLPAPVKSAPGFLVNRVLTPYLLEAMVIMDGGIAKETIDQAAEKFGMPMGPIELADQVGLDICLHVAEMLKSTLNREMPDPPQWLKDKVAKGELGKKSGKGLYEWKDGHAVKNHSNVAPPADAIDRMILPMLDVCVTCLREGVVANEDILDGAMVFGTGFAPFRGGPMRYARDRGPSEIRDTLVRLAQSYGKRFQPDPGWETLT